MDQYSDTRIQCFPILLCPDCFICPIKLFFPKFNKQRLISFHCNNCNQTSEDIPLKAYFDKLKRKFSINNELSIFESLLGNTVDIIQLSKGVCNTFIIDITCPHHNIRYTYYCPGCDMHVCPYCQLRDSKHLNHLLLKIQPRTIDECKRIYSETKQSIKEVKDYSISFIESVDTDIIERKELEFALKQYESNNEDLLQFLNVILATLIIFADTPLYHINALLDHYRPNRFKHYHHHQNNTTTVTGQYNFNKKALRQYLLNQPIYFLFPDISHKLIGHNDSVYHLTKLPTPSISNQSNLLLSTSDDDSLKVWDTLNGICLTTIRLTEVTVYFVLILRNGNLALCCDDESIKIYDMKLFKWLSTLQSTYNSIICCIELSNGHLVSGSNAIIIWDITTKQSITVIHRHKGDVNSLLQLNETQMASAADDHMIMIWNLRSLQCEFVLRGHNDAVFSLIKLSESQIASCGGFNDKAIRLWNSNTFQCETIISIMERSPSCLLRLHNRRIAIAFNDGIIGILNERLFNYKIVLKGFNLDYYAFLVIQLNERQICSNSINNTVIIWNI